MSGTFSGLINALLGRDDVLPQGGTRPIPLASMVMSNPIGTETVQGMSNADPSFQPGVEWGKMGMVSRPMYDMAQGAVDSALGWAGGTNMKTPPKELYHVAGSKWREGDGLKSLYSQMGDKAYDVYAKKWPESGDLAQYHPHNTFFYDNLADAQMHPGRGKILKIDPSKVDDLKFDDLEKPGFWTTQYDVSPESILEVMGKKKR